ncbi:unnamed protein product [Thlaspi arvense]|uniref:Uncharacterized protein n=1 Tax=Thlaspi arvense TaxID=13288 RepID=A0AAU9SHK3_THLAR|nr:unnamed protein product [Thlaspi arvense]
MGKEKAVSGHTIPLHSRPVTRALALALRASSKLTTSSEAAATTQINQGRVLRANCKRPYLDEKKANPPKKRAVLKDITNITCENSYRSCFNAAKIQVENIKQIKKGRAGSSMVASSSATSEVTDAKVEAVSYAAGVSLSGCTGTSLDTNEASCSFIQKQRSSRLPPRPLERSASTVEGSCSTVASSPKFVDIDSDDKDPLLCSLYAPEIYYNMRVAELKRRPFPDFMERTQKDVTQTMRGILVDWLVEVSEEYTLVPDTLYLTVYLIDWFLNGNYMERPKLQLLGITCMLIASKYEEICAPRIEEFCFITDNTYTRDQVLEMESQVLTHFSFQIYAPTSKTFLRRFLRAAQASHVNPSLEIEFLANYLTELTLMDYQFLKYLPSVIAASAVFLAKWTLNQSSHPWNPTLEHYTTYKASHLKASVHALQDLQLNTKGCPLNSIRMKYRQEKFKSVAVFSSPNLPDKLFF